MKYLKQWLGTMVVGLVITAIPATGWAQQMNFKNHGKPVKILSMAEIEAAAGGPQTITVHDPNEDADITYKAYPVKAIFDQVFGRDWIKGEEVLFTCLDGYQPSVPVELFRQFDGFFAFERVGAPTFSITDKSENNKKVNVGPLYLVWNNLKQKGMTAEDGPFWAYQLAGVDLTTFAEHFPRLAPPEKSSAQVKRGFLAFRKNCMECHTINGDGGKVGPELNYPVNVTEYYKESVLRKWIDNPTSIRFRTAMPGLHKDVPDRAQTIDAIIAYLKAMRGQKIKPK